MTDPSPTDQSIDSVPESGLTDDEAEPGLTDDEAEPGLTDDEADRIPDIPTDAVEAAERLTRLAQNASTSDAADHYRHRRAELAATHDYTPRLREEDETLVLYPSEWMADGTVQLDRIEETDRAVEVSLSGPGDADRFDEVAAANAAIVDRIASEYGPEHAANVQAFADFMSNHYVRQVTDATAAERKEFRTEYYPRNVWPSDEQRECLDRSLALLETIDKEFTGSDAIDDDTVDGDAIDEPR